VSKFLYDTKYDGDPWLSKFKPRETRKYYESQGEIWTNFKDAKHVVLEALKTQRDALNDEIAEVEAMTAETCPEDNDPYCSSRK